MLNESVISPPLIAWAAASRPLPGQIVCGDLHLVKSLPDGILLAVVDGLGHGHEATLAAKAAIAILNEAGDAPLEMLVKRCHEGLMDTRGAVMTVATLRPAEAQLTWLGVGNVEAVLLRTGPGAKTHSERALLRGGIVGYWLPPLRASTLGILRDDWVVLATDGIAARFSEGLVCQQQPQQVADAILERHFKGTDDALVLVARYLGRDHEPSNA